MVHIRDITLAAAALLLARVSGFYTKSGPVLVLDAKSFEKEIIQSEHAAVRLSKSHPYIK